MELRVLRYFLAVAAEGSVSRAAKVLHVTQPTLSRQLIELEEELGCNLLKRGSHGVTLTPSGVLLRRRAEDIIRLVDRTAGEFTPAVSELTGEIAIGAGESFAMRRLARVARKLRKFHPRVVFHLYSGNREDVTECLDCGVLDFCLFIQPADLTRYNTLTLPEKDTWGVLMRKDSPLAVNKSISPKDLQGVPLLVSRQVMRAPEQGNQLLAWFGLSATELNISATYNLIYNATFLVEEGVGYAVTLDRLADCSVESALCFRPLKPALHASLDLVWSKARPLSAVAAVFLQLLQADIREEPVW